MSPRDLKVGDHIVIERGKGGKVRKESIVKELAHCPTRWRRVGATHVNATDCYDNASDLDVIKS